MSIYQPLADFLASRKGDSWEASFVEIQNILHRSLPQSAYRYQAWWANQTGEGHSQTHGWRSAGWRTTRLDLERRRVTFERDRPAEIGRPSDSTSTILFERAARLTGITDRDALIGESLRALIAREAARALAELGGSMPDYRTPERERP